METPAYGSPARLHKVITALEEDVTRLNNLASGVEAMAGRLATAWPRSDEPASRDGAPPRGMVAQLDALQGDLASGLTRLETALQRIVDTL